MRPAQTNDAAIYQAFYEEVRSAFRSPMDKALATGVSIGLPRTAISMAIIKASMRCAAMAIVGSELEPTDFVATLLNEVEDVRKKLHASRGDLN